MSAKPAARKPRYDRDGLIRCRVCGCTEREACDPPCRWIEDDLCSVCALGVAAYIGWAMSARCPSPAAFIREARVQAELMRRGKTTYASN